MPVSAPLLIPTLDRILLDTLNEGRRLSHGIARNAFKHLAHEAAQSARGEKRETRMAAIEKKHQVKCREEGGVKGVAEKHLDDIVTWMEVRSSVAGGG